MTHSLVCWKCGASLAALTLPLRRLEVCKSCNAELHVCRMCVEYQLGIAKSCREPIAEEVREKERANFCDYFKPRENAYQPLNTGEVAQARAGLEALFGGAKPADSTPQTPADKARAELEALFSKK